MENSFLEKIQILFKNCEGLKSLNSILQDVIRHFTCTSGTIHTFNSSINILELKAHHGIPESVLDRIQKVPVGKGMAGIAAQRLQPVQVCNLQTDDSGVVRPGAKETKMAGAIAVPMIFQDTLRGVLGIAKIEAYEFSVQEVQFLQRIGELLAECVAVQTNLNDSKLN